MTNEKGTSMSRAQLLALQLSSDELLRIARFDAERVYRDLARFVIRISREPDGWHVDFDLKGCDGSRRRPTLRH